MEKELKKVKKILDDDLKKQTQEGLYKVYKELGCLGVAKEIRAGRNVTKNAEYGIRMCVHSKIGPRVDPETLEFYPMTKKGKEILEKFVPTVDKYLDNAGFKKMSPALLSDLKRKDKDFEQMIKERRKKLGSNR